jgi:exosome complex component RRP43
MDSFQKLHPREYAMRFLEQDIRPDARPLFGVRSASVSRGALTSCYGSALAQLGSTSVVAGVRAELGRVEPGTPLHCVVANVELLPLCSPRFLPGKPPELARAVGAWMNDIVSGGRGRDARATRRALVDSAALLLTHLAAPERTVGSLLAAGGSGAGDDEHARLDDDEARDAPLLAWHLSVDMYCLDYDGNVFDAALMALVAALHDVRLPTVSRDERGQYVRSLERTVPLKLNFVPISTTFALIDQFIIADPTDAESELETGSLSIVLDAAGAIVSVRKPGGSPIAVSALRKCVDVAKSRVSVVQKLLLRA